LGEAREGVGQRHIRIDGHFKDRALAALLHYHGRHTGLVDQFGLVAPLDLQGFIIGHGHMSRMRFVGAFGQG
jgi:hypothetical protein